MAPEAEHSREDVLTDKNASWATKQLQADENVAKWLAEAKLTDVSCEVEMFTDGFDGNIVKSRMVKAKRLSSVDDSVRESMVQVFTKDASDAIMTIIKEHC